MFIIVLLYKGRLINQSINQWVSFEVSAKKAQHLAGKSPNFTLSSIQKKLSAHHSALSVPTLWQSVLACAHKWAHFALVLTFEREHWAHLFRKVSAWAHMWMHSVLVLKCSHWCSLLSALLCSCSSQNALKNEHWAHFWCSCSWALAEHRPNLGKKWEHCEHEHKHEGTAQVWARARARRYCPRSEHEHERNVRSRALPTLLVRNDFFGTLAHS